MGLLFANAGARFEGGKSPRHGGDPPMRFGLSSPDLATRALPWCNRDGPAKPELHFAIHSRGGCLPPAKADPPPLSPSGDPPRPVKSGHRGCFGRNRHVRGFRRDNRLYSDCHSPFPGGAFDCLRVATESANACRVLAGAVRAICCRVGIPTRDCGEFSRP